MPLWKMAKTNDAGANHGQDELAANRLGTSEPVSRRMSYRIDTLRGDFAEKHVEK